MSDGHALKQEPPALTITQVAARTGLSADTLRYYERAGLIERVARTPHGHRSDAASDLGWLEFLIRLRETGMSISRMQQYARLRSSDASATCCGEAPRRAATSLSVRSGVKPPSGKNAA
ncbi:MerR family transcriptional regulator [Nonomuraea sp. N2-4H]|uniref:MerR family transcriptional regulator n=1 Tax=Nonomuraea sp. N2-4H TaxID=3128898 RepID=UPI0032455B66